VKRSVRSNFNTQIYEEACEWFVECRAGDLDPAARAEFDRWLRKSPEHQTAYLEIAAIWNEGPHLDPANRWDLGRLISQAAEDSADIVALDPSRTADRAPAAARNDSRSLGAALAGRRRLWAIAASILLTTAALAAYMLTAGGVYATELGEQRSLALADGSTVQLNSLSKLRIRYSDHERAVDLLRGEALFHVAKDATRPFIVHSGPAAVKAVGTQFDVYRKADGTVVTVVEGRVAILRIPEPRDSPGMTPARSDEGHQPSPSKRESDPAQQNLAPGGDALELARRDGLGPIVLTAGEQITVSATAANRTPRPNLAGATSWTQRQLVFDSASLAEVAEEFNRYNARELVIDPSALGALHISGVFSSTDPASLGRFLRDRPGLRVTETPTEIRVEKAL
jgi:transmembrane sensor